LEPGEDHRRPHEEDGDGRRHREPNGKAGAASVLAEPSL
jgi:hypothetical protein